MDEEKRCGPICIAEGDVVEVGNGTKHISVVEEPPEPLTRAQEVTNDMVILAVGIIAGLFIGMAAFGGG